MTLKISSKFPGGNVAAVVVTERDGLPEVRFASDPCGGAEALWFYFRIEETAPDSARHTKIRLTWTLVDQVYGSEASGPCVPVFSTPGHTWSRLKQAEEIRNEDGLRELSWLLAHPAPVTEVALCFPYGPPELDNALEKARDFWKTVPIGISQGAHQVKRVYHNAQTSGHHPSVFVMARQYGGETPGSWVLDGLLRQWALNRKGGYSLWTLPFADIDGVTWGWFGRGNGPHELGRAWGDAPTRHEARVIQTDLLRWKNHGKPVLLLDLQATRAFEHEGVYAAISEDPEEVKWCNVIKNELKADYAAPVFTRSDAVALSAIPGTTFAAWARQALGVPVLTLRVPYHQAPTGVLTQKAYREIGQRIALAIQRRNG